MFSFRLLIGTLTIQKELDFGYQVDVTWRLEKFFKHGFKVFSPKFTCGRTNWRLLCFPKGNQTDFVAVYLDIADSRDFSPHWLRGCHFSLTIMNHKDPEKDKSNEAMYNFTKELHDWGFKQLIKISDIKSSSAGYVKDEAVTIRCQMKVFRDDEASQAMHKADIWDSWKETGFVGLKNQGATCYLNSLIQSMFHLPCWRKAVFHMPTQEDVGDDNEKSIPLALQRVFYRLQYHKKAVGTRALTRSFGWDSIDAFTQHDVQELIRVLYDNLETKMKGTAVDGTVSSLFEGSVHNYIKCLDVEYESTRDEKLYDIQLIVSGCKDIYASFEKYTEVEVLEGDNKYRAEGHGLQRANKGCNFTRLPPVLQLQLCRFAFGMEGDTYKVNDRYEFPETLDLTKFMVETADTSVPAIYKLHTVFVHQGDVGGGHYYAFIRPDCTSDWYKFDDDNVVPAQAEHAIDDTFGGDELYAFERNGKVVNSSHKRVANAYMLQYIRVDQLSQVVAKLQPSDIPTFLKDKFDGEITMEEQKAKERREAHLYLNLHFITDDQLSTSPDLVDLADPETVINAKGLKTEVLGDYLDRESPKLFGVPANRLFLWEWVNRKNSTRRLDAVVVASEWFKELDTVSAKQNNDVSFFVEILPPNVSRDLRLAEIGNSLVMIFFKFYEPHTNKLVYVGRRLVPKGSTIQSLHAIMCELASLEPATLLECYEEVKPSRVEAIPYQKSLLDAEISNGDIIVFQPTIAASLHSTLPYPNAPSYYMFLEKRIRVDFLWKTDPFDGNRKISIVLSRDSPYLTVVKELARAANVDHMLLRLTEHTEYLNKPALVPIKFSDQRNITLKDMVKGMAPSINVPGILYYEILDVSIDQVENTRNFEVVWWPSLLKAKRASDRLVCNISIQKHALVSDLCRAVQESNKFPLSLNGVLRIHAVYNSRISRVLPDEEPLSKLLDTFELHCMEKSELELAAGPEEGRLVQILHVERDRFSAGNTVIHGLPILLWLKNTVFLGQFKIDIRPYINVSDEDFVNWKFGVSIGGKFEYLKEGGLIDVKALTPLDFVALEHKEQSSPLRKTVPHERALKLYN